MLLQRRPTAAGSRPDSSPSHTSSSSSSSSSRRAARNVQQQQQLQPARLAVLCCAAGNESSSSSSIGSRLLAGLCSGLVVLGGSSSPPLLQPPAAHAATMQATVMVVANPAPTATGSSDLVPVALQPELAPDQSAYDPADPDLREAAGQLQAALNASSVEEEEARWSGVIDRFGGSKAVWAPDVVGRAFGNRGNARSRQGKLAEALADYNAAIILCPWSVDPVLNRGVALEALGRWEEAASDYRAVLAVAPDDPSPWNNLGNTYGGMRRWADAEACFAKAYALAPNFSFAAANRALAMFEQGKTEEAIREMRSLLRRYPDFDDMRAGLAAAQWAAGREGAAETQWARVDDIRYKDASWLEKERRWPPTLVASLQALLQLQSL